MLWFCVKASEAETGKLHQFNPSRGRMQCGLDPRQETWLVVAAAPRERECLRCVQR